MVPVTCPERVDSGSMAMRWRLPAALGAKLGAKRRDLWVGRPRRM